MTDQERDEKSEYEEHHGGTEGGRRRQATRGDRSKPFRRVATIGLSVLNVIQQIDGRRDGTEGDERDSASGEARLPCVRLPAAAGATTMRQFFTHCDGRIAESERANHAVAGVWVVVT